MTKEEPMTLREAKNAVREYIRTFTDQKLADVYAFNADGKMKYMHPCRCLLGVGSSEGALHTLYCMKNHLEEERAKHELVVGILLPAAEIGYCFLGIRGAFSQAVRINTDYLRQCRLSAILRAEMRLRDRRSKVSQATAMEAVGV